MASQAIYAIRSLIPFYEEFANKPELFIEIRENSVIVSLTEFIETAKKLNTSDNYKPTEEEQNYWNYMLAEMKEFQTKIEAEKPLMDEEDSREEREWSVCVIATSIKNLYREFNGRLCQNGETLACIMD